MSKYKFKDGSIIEASSAEEAKAKHKVTAFYDHFEIEKQLKKLQTNIDYFLESVNRTLNFLDRHNVIYSTDSNLTDTKAEYFITVTNKEGKDKTYAIVLEGGYNNGVWKYKEKIGNEFKQLKMPVKFIHILKEFLGE